MREGIAHQVVNDAGMKIWNSYAVRAWPTLVLIDPHGRIAGETSGEILAEEFSQHIREVIRQNPGAIDLAPLDFRAEAQAEPERPLRYPAKLLLSGDRLYISDTGHHRILEVRLDEDGMGGELVRVFGRGEAGLLDGPAGQAAFNHPRGLSLAGRPEVGKLYVADTGNHAVRVIHLATGEVTTAAGTGQKAHGRRSLGAPTETAPIWRALRSPWAVLAVGETVFIAMAGSHQVWALTSAGQIGPFAGNGVEDLVDGPLGEASFNQPSDLALGMGYLFVADPEASAVRAVSLGESPRVVTLVGQGLFEWGDQDGPTAEALLQHPTGLAFSQQVIYVADTYNHKIKLLDPAAGRVSTLIGDGKPGWKDGAFAEARLYEPEGVQASAGRLYIADTNNHQVRVAELETRRVQTFRLRGIERLPAPAAGRELVETLDPLLVAPGRVRVVLDVRLPAGYKRNPDMPSILRVSGEGGQAEQTLSFPAGEEIAWVVHLGADRVLRVELALYYCKADQAPLCLIHARRLQVPLRVSSAGQAEVRAPYPINAAV